MLKKRPLSTDGGKRPSNISFGPNVVNEIPADIINGGAHFADNQYRPRSGTRLAQLENTPQLTHVDSSDKFAEQIINSPAGRKPWLTEMSPNIQTAIERARSSADDQEEYSQWLTVPAVESLGPIAEINKNKRAVTPKKPPFNPRHPATHVSNSVLKSPRLQKFKGEVEGGPVSALTEEKLTKANTENLDFARVWKESSRKFPIVAPYVLAGDSGSEDEYSDEEGMVNSSTVKNNPPGKDTPLDIAQPTPPLSANTLERYQNSYFSQELYDEDMEEVLRPLSAYIAPAAYDSLSKTMEENVVKQYDEELLISSLKRRRLKRHKGRNLKSDQEEAERMADYLDDTPFIYEGSEPIDVMYFKTLNGFGSVVSEETKLKAQRNMKLLARQHRSNAFLKTYYPDLLSENFFPSYMPWSLLLTYFVQHKIELYVPPHVVIPELVLCCKNRASDKELYSLRWIFNSGDNAASVPSSASDRQTGPCTKQKTVSFFEREFNPNDIIHYFFQQSLRVGQMNSGGDVGSDFLVATLHSNDGEHCRHLDMASFYKLFGSAAMVSSSIKENSNSSYVGKSRTLTPGLFAEKEKSTEATTFDKWKPNDMLLFQASPLEEIKNNRYVVHYIRHSVTASIDIKYFCPIFRKLGLNAELLSGNKEKNTKNCQENINSEEFVALREISASTAKDIKLIELMKEKIVPFVIQFAKLLRLEFKRNVEFISVSFILKNDGTIFWITDMSVRRPKFVIDSSLLFSVANCCDRARKQLDVVMLGSISKQVATKMISKLVSESVVVTSVFETARRFVTPCVRMGIRYAVKADVVSDVLSDAKETTENVIAAAIGNFGVASVAGAVGCYASGDINSAIDTALGGVIVHQTVRPIAAHTASDVLMNFDAVREKQIENRRNFISSFVDRPNSTYFGQNIPFSKLLAIMNNYSEDEFRCKMKLVDSFLYDKENGGIICYHTGEDGSLCRKTGVSFRAIKEEFWKYYDINLASLQSGNEIAEDDDVEAIAGYLINSRADCVGLNYEKVITMLKTKLVDLKLDSGNVLQIALPRYSANKRIFVVRVRRFGLYDNDLDLMYALKSLGVSRYNRFMSNDGNMSGDSDDVSESIGVSSSEFTTNFIDLLDDADEWDIEFQMDSIVASVLGFILKAFELTVVDGIFEFIQDADGVMWLSYISHCGVMKFADFYTSMYSNCVVNRAYCTPTNYPSDGEHLRAVSDWSASMAASAETVQPQSPDSLVISSTTNAVAVTETDSVFLGLPITELPNNSSISWVELLEFLCYSSPFGIKDGRNGDTTTEATKLGRRISKPGNYKLPFKFADAVFSELFDSSRHEKNYICARSFYISPDTGKLCCTRNISKDDFLVQCASVASMAKKAKNSFASANPYVAIWYNHLEGWTNLQETSLHRLMRCDQLFDINGRNYIQLNCLNGSRITEIYACCYVKHISLLQGSKFSANFNKSFLLGNDELTAHASGVTKFCVMDMKLGMEVSNNFIECMEESINMDLAKLTTSILRMIARAAKKLVLNMTVFCYRDSKGELVVANIADMVVNDVKVEDLLLKETEITYISPDGCKEFDSTSVAAAASSHSSPNHSVGSPVHERDRHLSMISTVSSLTLPLGIDCESECAIYCPSCEEPMAEICNFCYKCGAPLNLERDRISSRAQTSDLTHGRFTEIEDLAECGIAAIDSFGNDNDDKMCINNVETIHTSFPNSFGLSNRIEGASDDNTVDTYANIKGMDMSVIGSDFPSIADASGSGESLNEHAAAVSNMNNAQLEQKGVSTAVENVIEFPTCELSGDGVVDDDSNVEEYRPSSMLMAHRRSDDDMDHSQSATLTFSAPPTAGQVLDTEGGSYGNGFSGFSFATAASVVANATAMGPQHLECDLCPQLPFSMYYLDRIEVSKLLVDVVDYPFYSSLFRCCTPTIVFYDFQSGLFNIIDSVDKGKFSKFYNIPSKLVSLRIKRLIHNFPKGYVVEASLYDTCTNNFKRIDSDGFADLLKNQLEVLVSSGGKILLEIVFVPESEELIQYDVVYQRHCAHYEVRHSHVEPHEEAVININGMFPEDVRGSVPVNIVTKITTLLRRFMKHLSINCGYNTIDCNLVVSLLGKDMLVSVRNISYTLEAEHGFSSWFKSKAMEQGAVESKRKKGDDEVEEPCKVTRFVELQELTFIDVLEFLLQRSIPMSFVKILPTAVNSNQSVYKIEPLDEDYDSFYFPSGATVIKNYCYFSVSSGHIVNQMISNWDLVRESFCVFAKAQLEGVDPSVDIERSSFPVATLNNFLKTDIFPATRISSVGPSAPSTVYRESRGRQRFVGDSEKPNSVLLLESDFLEATNFDSPFNSPLSSPPRTASASQHRRRYRISRLLNEKAGNYLQVYIESSCETVTKKSKNFLSDYGKPSAKKSRGRQKSDSDDWAIPTVMANAFAQSKDNLTEHLGDIRLFCKYTHSCEDTFEKVVEGPTYSPIASAENDNNDDMRDSYQFGYGTKKYGCKSDSNPSFMKRKYDLDDVELCAQMKEITMKFCDLFVNPDKHVVEDLEYDAGSEYEAEMKEVEAACPAMKIYRVELEFVYSRYKKQLWLAWVNDMYVHVLTDADKDYMKEMAAIRALQDEKVKEAALLEKLKHVTETAAQNALILEAKLCDENDETSEGRLNLSPAASVNSNVTQFDIVSEPFSAATCESPLSPVSNMFPELQIRDNVSEADNGDGFIAVPRPPTDHMEGTCDSRDNIVAEVKEVTNHVVDAFERSTNQFILAKMDTTVRCKGGVGSTTGFFSLTGEIIGIPHFCIVSCAHANFLQNTALTFFRGSGAKLSAPSVLCVPQTEYYMLLLHIWRVKNMIPKNAPAQGEELGYKLKFVIELLIDWLMQAVGLDPTSKMLEFDMVRLNSFMTTQIEFYINRSALLIQKCLRAVVTRTILRRYLGMRIRTMLALNPDFLKETRSEQKKFIKLWEWRSVVKKNIKAKSVSFASTDPVCNIEGPATDDDVQPRKSKKKKLKKRSAVGGAAALSSTGGKAKKCGLPAINGGGAKEPRVSLLVKKVTPSKASSVLAKPKLNIPAPVGRDHKTNVARTARKSSAVDATDKKISKESITLFVSDLLDDIVESFFISECVSYGMEETLELLTNAMEETSTVRMMPTFFITLPRVGGKNVYNCYQADESSNGSITKESGVNWKFAHMAIKKYPKVSSSDTPKTVSLVYDGDRRVPLTFTEAKALYNAEQLYSGSGTSDQTPSKTDGLMQLYKDMDISECAPDEKLKILGTIIKKSSFFFQVGTDCLIGNLTKTANEFRKFGPRSGDCMIYCEYVNSNPKSYTNYLRNKGKVTSFGSKFAGVCDSVDPKCQTGLPGWEMRLYQYIYEDSANTVGGGFDGHFNTGSAKKVKVEVTPELLYDTFIWNQLGMDMSAQCSVYDSVSLVLNNIMSVLQIEHEIWVDRIECEFFLLRLDADKMGRYNYDENHFNLSLGNIIKMEGVQIRKNIDTMIKNTSSVVAKPVAEPISEEAKYFENSIANPKASSSVTYECLTEFLHWESILNILSDNGEKDEGCRQDDDESERDPAGKQDPSGSCLIKHFRIPLSLFRDALSSARDPVYTTYKVTDQSGKISKSYNVRGENITTKLDAIHKVADKKKNINVCNDFTLMYLKKSDKRLSTAAKDNSSMGTFPINRGILSSERMTEKEFKCVVCSENDDPNMSPEERYKLNIYKTLVSRAHSFLQLYSYQKSAQLGEDSLSDRLFIKCFYHRYAADLEDDSDALCGIDDKVPVDANIFCRYVDRQSGVLTPVLDGSLIVRLQDITRYLLKRIKESQIKKRITSPIEYMELEFSLTTVGNLADNVWLTNGCCTYDRYVVVEPKSKFEVEIRQKISEINVEKGKIEAAAISDVTVLPCDNSMTEPTVVVPSVLKTPVLDTVDSVDECRKELEQIVASVAPNQRHGTGAIARSIEQLNPILDRLLQKHQHIVNLQEMASLKAENAIIHSGPKDSYIQCEIDADIDSLSYGVVKREETLGNNSGNIRNDSCRYMDWRCFLEILSTVDNSKQIHVPLTVFPELPGDAKEAGSPPRGNILAPTYTMFYSTWEGPFVKSTGVDADSVLSRFVIYFGISNGFECEQDVPLSSLVASVCSFDKKHKQSVYINKECVIPASQRDTDASAPSLIVTTVFPFVKRDILSLAEFTSTSLGISNKKVFEVLDLVNVEQVKLWKQSLFSRPAKLALGERFSQGKHYAQSLHYMVEKEPPKYRYICYYDCKSNLTADLVISSQRKRRRNFHFSKIDTVYVECRNFDSYEIIDTFTTSLSGLTHDARESIADPGNDLLFSEMLKTKVFDLLLEIIASFCSPNSRSVGQGRSTSYLLTNFALELVFDRSVNKLWLLNTLYIRYMDMLDASDNLMYYYNKLVAQYEGRFNDAELQLVNTRFLEAMQRARTIPEMQEESEKSSTPKRNERTAKRAEKYAAKIIQVKKDKESRKREIDQQEKRKEKKSEKEENQNQERRNEKEENQDQEKKSEKEENQGQEKRSEMEENQDPEKRNEKEMGAAIGFPPIVKEVKLGETLASNLSPSVDQERMSVVANANPLPVSSDAAPSLHGNLLSGKKNLMHLVSGVMAGLKIPKRDTDAALCITPVPPTAEQKSVRALSRWRNAISVVKEQNVASKNANSLDNASSKLTGSLAKWKTAVALTMDKLSSKISGEDNVAVAEPKKPSHSAIVPSDAGSERNIVEEINNDQERLHPEVTNLEREEATPDTAETSNIPGVSKAMVDDATKLLEKMTNQETPQSEVTQTSRKSAPLNTASVAKPSATLPFPVSETVSVYSAPVVKPPIGSPSGSRGPRKQRGARIRSRGASASFTSLISDSDSSAVTYSTKKEVTGISRRGWYDWLDIFATEDSQSSQPYRMLIPAAVFYCPYKGHSESNENEKKSGKFIGFFNIAGGKIAKKSNFESSKIYGSFKKFSESKGLSSKESGTAVLRYKNDINKEFSAVQHDTATELIHSSMHLSAIDLKVLLSNCTEHIPIAFEEVHSVNKLKAKLHAAVNKSIEDRREFIANMMMQQPTTPSLVGKTVSLGASFFYLGVKSRLYNNDTNDSLENAVHPSTVIYCNYNIKNNMGMVDRMTSVSTRLARSNTADSAASNSEGLKEVENNLKFYVLNPAGDVAGAKAYIPLDRFIQGLDSFVTAKTLLVAAIYKVLKQMSRSYQNTLHEDSNNILERQDEEGKVIKTLKDVSLVNVDLEVMIDDANAVWFLCADSTAEYTTTTIMSKVADETACV